MGVIAAALIYVRDSFHLSTVMQEVLVIAVLVGVMIGALVGGAVADRIGRRKTLVWGAILFIVGSILAPLSPNVYVLFVARALLGVAVGFTSVTAPVYVSELAPPQSRGMLIGLYQFASPRVLPWLTWWVIGLLHRRDGDGCLLSDWSPRSFFSHGSHRTGESPMAVCAEQVAEANPYSSHIQMRRPRRCSWKTFGSV